MELGWRGIIIFFNNVIVSFHELLKHIEKEHVIVKTKVTLQLKKIESNYTSANLAAGIKYNLADNIHSYI